jgi:predicted dehydrogenase
VATGGRGVDAVLITADTKSDQPIATAGDIAREQAIVVAVGAVGLTIPRKTYYEKELRFRVSRSYGPGRNDHAYEQEGIDYPYAYVRWTENRNMEAFLRLVRDDAVDLAPLITHRIDIADGARAYDLITGGSGEPFLGVVLRYPGASDAAIAPRKIEVARTAAQPAEVRVGFIGAGNFARSVLLPAFRDAGGDLVGIAAATGVSAQHAADRFRFRYCTTSADEILGDDSVNTVVVATRHDLHAAQTLGAIAGGRHVFVEKPLCLNEAELDAIRVAYESRDPRPLLMVGFNRRFAPMAVELKEFFAGSGEPLVIHYRVNAGHLPRSEWVQTAEGGGRLIGEGVHFIDFAHWLTGDAAAVVFAAAAANAGRYSDDNLAVTIRFRNGSLFTLSYIAAGDRAIGKERIEVHSAGRSAVLDDFRRLELTKGGRRRVERSWLRSDKGHRAEVAAFVAAIRDGKESPIAFEDIVRSMTATFAAAESLAGGAAIEVAAR